MMIGFKINKSLGFFISAMAVPWVEMKNRLLIP